MFDIILNYRWQCNDWDYYLLQNQSERSAADAILGPAIHKALLDVGGDGRKIYPLATTYLKELMCVPGVTGAFKEVMMSFKSSPSCCVVRRLFLNFACFKANPFVRECLGGGGTYELELNRVRLRNLGSTSGLSQSKLLNLHFLNLCVVGIPRCNPLCIPCCRWHRAYHYEVQGI